MNLQQTALALTLIITSLFWQSSSCNSSKGNNRSTNANMTTNVNSNTSPTPSQTPRQVSKGRWGGEGIGIEVGDTATIEFDCAHATINEKMVLDQEGKFQAKGFYVREKGGPVRSDENEQRQAATFMGKVEGDTLTLRIQLEGEKTDFGTFTLTRGKSGRIRKCL
ncbi:MAG TPA: hypothetical protein VIB00_01225 [Pyrinomonadaceae bacterium]|jgi:hypothetical protein